MSVVAGVLQNDGIVEATGAGFRGGNLDGSDVYNGPRIYRTSNPYYGAEKGESIAGWSNVYDAHGGRYGRGAPANGESYSVRRWLIPNDRLCDDCGTKVEGAETVIMRRVVGEPTVEILLNGMVEVNFLSSIL